MTTTQKLESVKAVFTQEISSLQVVRENLGDSAVLIIETIASCEGKCVLCGMGKSGHIAKKISATLSSLGTPSFFLHPGEALHGDLGMMDEKDVVLLLSNSGETREILEIIPSLKLIGTKLIGVTCGKNSSLAKECDITQVLPVRSEAGRLNLAPTSSTTAMLVFGDAVALTLAEASGFDRTDFGKYHPAGALGKKVLLRVRDIMATGDDLPTVKTGKSITEAIMEMSKKGLGVVAIVDETGELKGILTDGDLRRAIEKKADLYDGDVDSIMTYNPQCITDEYLLVEALQRLRDSHLNNYPVIDTEQRVIGMLTWQMIIRAGVAF